MAKMSMVARALSMPRHRYVVGYVVGLVWSDGGEWLFCKGNLTSQGTGKDSHATVYLDVAKALKQAEQMAAVWPDREVFYRPYVHETHRLPAEMPKHYILITADMKRGERVIVTPTGVVKTTST